MRTAGASNGVIVYDPLGRIFQYAGTVGGTTLTFLYDGDALVAEYDGAGTRLRAYAHGADAGADNPIVWYEEKRRNLTQSISTQVGAWSLAFSRPRYSLSTPASRKASAACGLSSRWSMRKPASRCQQPAV